MARLPSANAKRERRTIRRLVISHIIAFGMIVLATGLGSYLVARHMLVRKLDANMSARLSAAERKWGTGGLAGLDVWLDALSRRGGHFAYILTGPDGRALRSVDGVEHVLGDGWGFARFDDADDGSIDPARTLTTRLPDGSRLTIVADRDYIEQFDAVVLGFIIFSLPLLFGTAVVGSLSLEASIRRRLIDVNATAAAIMEGELDQRIPIAGVNDEFDQLATTLNGMLDRINMLVGEVRRMNAYIAHDLRTPLVAIAEELRNRSDECAIGPDCSAAMGNAADAVDRLIYLFGMILEIGEITPIRVREKGRQVDLSALVETLASAHREVAEDSGRMLGCTVQPGVELFGIGDLLAQALINLIQNALTHTPGGTHIHVGLDASDGVAHLTVTDDGLGLPDADRQDLLADDRPSKSGSDTGRTAIGLKLINAIATAHHGALKIEDAQPGLRAIIELPLAPPSRRAAVDGSRLRA